MPLEFVQSCLKGEQLSHDGFFYTRNRTVNDRTYWKCVEYRTTNKCPGVVHTVNDAVVYVGQKKHTHEIDDVSCRRPKFSKKEVAALLEGYQKRRAIFHGNTSKKLTNEMKIGAWDSLTDEVNVCNVSYKRSPDEIRRKMRNLKRVLKKDSSGDGSPLSEGNHSKDQNLIDEVDCDQEHGPVAMDDYSAPIEYYGYAEDHCMEESEASPSEEALKIERSKLQIKRDRLHIEREKVQVRRELLRVEREKLKIKREQLQIGRDTLIAIKQIANDVGRAVEAVARRDNFILKESVS